MKMEPSEPNNLPAAVFVMSYLVVLGRCWWQQSWLEEASSPNLRTIAGAEDEGAELCGHFKVHSML